MIVCRSDELPPGGMRTVDRNGVPIVVVRSAAGSLHSVRGTCAHQGADLGQGRLTWLIESERPGCYQLSRDGEILRCPWHGFEYDVVSGRCISDPSLRLRTYVVAESDGFVRLEDM
ncbi:MAG TPA: Rieske (2Fe-2S) protein [Solirubrobacteraceae bacterium]